MTDTIFDRIIRREIPADIDGASDWQGFRSITLPLMTPIVLFNLVLGIVTALQVFTQIWILTEGGPAGGGHPRTLDPRGAADLARRLFANPVIHAIHTVPFEPERLPEGGEHAFELRRIAIRDLTDDDLVRLSREAHLFLSLDEMRAIRSEYRRLDRDPTDIELETLAQTWSEHCVHKTLKSTVVYRGAPSTPSSPDPITWTGRPGHVVHPDGSVTIK